MCATGRLITVVVSIGLVFPSLVLAQAPRAGIVTTLEGNVTARRVALPDPVPLKFKDDVFLQDTVTTGDKSLARMLLGGKAVVTVRERSVVTITEVPGKSTIDLESGKFALAVARERMRPGEEILIRTPNAIAGVRGTVVITEVSRQGAQAGGGAPGVLTSFYVLRGSTYAQQLDPSTRQPAGTALQIGAMQAYSQAGGAVPRVAPVPTEQVGQITSGLQPSGPKGGSSAGLEQLKVQAVQTAVGLLSVLTGGGDTQVAFLIAPSAAKALPSTPPTTGSSQTSAPITPPVVAAKEQNDQQQAQNSEQASNGSGGQQASTGEQSSSPPTSGSNTPGTSGSNTQPPVTQEPTTPSTTTEPTVVVMPPLNPPAVLSGTLVRTETTPLVDLDGDTVTSTGGQPLVLVAPGADITLASPLAHIRNSTITGDGAGIDIRGKIRSTDQTPFIDVDPTQVILQGSVVSVVGAGAELRLAGPFLRDVGGTLINGGGQTRSFMVVHDGGLVHDTSPGPFFSFTNSTVLTFGSFLSDRRSGALPSTVELAGPFLEASGSLITAVSTTLLDQAGNARLCCSLFAVGQGAGFTSSTASPLVSLVGTGLFTGQHVFSIFDTSSIFGESTIVLPGTVTLAGPLLTATASSVISGLSDLLGIFRSALTSTTTAPLITLTDSGVVMGGPSPIDSSTVAGRILDLSANASLPATLTLKGPLLKATNAVMFTTDDVFGVFNGASLSSTTTSPLLSFAGSTVATGAPGQFLVASSGAGLSGSTVSLAGPLLSATQSSLANGTPSITGSGSPQFIGFLGGTTLTSTTSLPFVSLSATNVNSGGNFFDVRGFSKATLAGPVLSATAGSLVDSSTLGFGSRCCQIFRVTIGSEFTGTGTGALFQLANSTLKSGPDLGPNSQSGGLIFYISDFGTVTEPVAPAKLTLAGPLLAATSSTITSLSNTFDLERSTFVSTTSAPLISLTSSTLTAGGLDPFTSTTVAPDIFHFVASATAGTAGPAATATLAGPFLSATAGSKITTGSAGGLIGIFNGAVVSSTTTSPLVSLTNSNMTLGTTLNNGDVVEISGLGGPGGTTRPTLSFGGSFLRVTGGATNLSAGYVFPHDGGQVISTSATEPLVAISGGTHTVGTNNGIGINNGGAALRVFGRSTETASETVSGNVLTLGTDQPLQHGGSGAFVSVGGGATVTGKSVLLLDTALLAASAPLLAINGATTTVSTTNQLQALDLIQKAKLTSVGPIFKIDAGTLNIAGDAIRVRNGSLLQVTGDLMSILNGGKVNITNNGVLLSAGASGPPGNIGSVVNISGAIVNFGGTGGNQLNITNTLCSVSCYTPPGTTINVALQNGAIQSNVSISGTPIKNPGLGALNLSNGASTAVISVSGANTKVTISGN